MTGLPEIRWARQEDVALILFFIRAAAEEQLPGAEVTATEERLASTLHFGPPTNASIPQTGFARALLLFSTDRKPAGLLIYFYNYSTWAAAPGVCLEELYVAPDFRQHGFGHMLIQAMACAAKAAGCVKMDWVCLKDNKKALCFYDKLGAQRMDTWNVLKVDSEGIRRLATNEAWEWA
ncbi:acyl-CoA N-acyltransferase [Trichoderma gracile]